MVWQSSTEGHKDLFQGNFANNNTLGWSLQPDFGTGASQFYLKSSITIYIVERELACFLYCVTTHFTN